MFRVISILTVLLFLHQHVLAAAVLNRDPVSAESISPPSAAHLNKLSTRQDSAFGVAITAGSVESSAAHTYGTEVHVISDQEINSFDLSDLNLKRAVEAYVGRAPNDAFLRSPTPWDDLYTTYQWDQVTTTIAHISAEVMDITTTPTIVKTQIFENNSDDTGDFAVAVSETVSNTATSTWTGSDTVSFGQSISYDIAFLGTGVGGETSFGYESSWGQGGSESEAVTMGSTAGVTVPLGPGESVTAVLKANRGSMKVLVTYRATLSGQVAVNYDPTFEDHHFWAYDVNAVLSAGGLPTEQIITEELNIGYYSDASVELLDR